VHQISKKKSKDIKYQLVYFDSDRFVLGVVFYENRREIREGDVMIIGLIINVDIRIMSIDFGPYLYQLICSNGMTTRRANYTRLGVTSLEEFSGEFNNYMDLYLSYGNKALEYLNSIKDKQLVDPAGYLHGFAASNRMSARFEKEILDRVPALPSKTEYDLLTLITTFANSLRPSQWFRLIQDSGNRVFAVNKRCQCCHREM
jgi:hypothetical protein